MRFAFSAEEEAFRAEVVEFLADYRDLDAFFLQGHKWEKVREFFRAMGRRGWLSIGWPQEAGGAGAPPAHEYILWDEVGYARAARNPLASGVVAKTIARYGTEAQRERWLPPIRAGELHFSLGYSEPEAGSDLASVRCRAERRGDVYVVTGQKCWQSYAQDADQLWLLCRTGSQESRGRGLTLLIVDLAAPGVTVGPLPTLDGDQLNEVRLDGVEVLLDHVVDDFADWPDPVHAADDLADRREHLVEAAAADEAVHRGGDQQVLERHAERLGSALGVPRLGPRGPQHPRRLARKAAGSDRVAG